MRVLNLPRPLLSRSPGGFPRRRAAYAVPTLFTAGNILMGFLAIMKSIQGLVAGASGNLGANPHFSLAAMVIGIAVVLDGLDGRIARWTNTASDFGRELDSLADVITFGIAPAVLAFAWGIRFAAFPLLHTQVYQLGYFVSFLFLLCGAARLARFNVQKNPVPKNPGRSDRRYFVGLPIPAAAALVAAVVYMSGGVPLEYWPFSAAWLFLLAALSFLMVSTWRYPSFKDIQLLRPRSPLILISWGALVYLLWHYPQPMLLAMAGAYVASGILIRIGGVMRRHWHRVRKLESPVG